MRNTNTLTITIEGWKFADTFMDSMMNSLCRDSSAPGALIDLVFGMLRMFHEEDLRQSIPENFLPDRLVRICLDPKDSDTVRIYLDKGWSLSIKVQYDCDMHTSFTVALVGVPADLDFAKIRKKSEKQSQSKKQTTCS